MTAFILFIKAQSPHGESFNIDCSSCHSSDGWKMLKEDMQFDHSKTGFLLDGQHNNISCTECHTSLKFTTEKSQCMDCHVDMHNNTLGKDCDQCHTPSSWIIPNVIGLHQQSRFPLLGSHTNADCIDCHKSATNLSFEPLSTDCIDCHRNDYMSTTKPNHMESGYSTSCTECHSVTSMEWIAAGIEHSFFPLNQGHAISCMECHESGSYGNLSNECFQCHQPDYNEAADPNHVQLNLQDACNECHTLAPGWKPANFRQHDNEYFPIYSGKHNNEWTSCIECHTNPADYASFSCISCHEHNQSETDEEHQGVNGYTYQSDMCFACHPRGDESGAFNHSLTGFTLTGAHLEAECLNCHTNGFAGTSSQCVSCHQVDFSKTTNPNHTKIGLDPTCKDCHTTNPGWKPAEFPVHNNYYALTGAHASIANECVTCHNGDYNTTSNLCYTCHTTDYTQTTNPNHKQVSFPTSCNDCHSTSGWKPSTFNHNNYFALTGAHATIANDCATCHNGNYTSTPNTCYECHKTEYTQTSNPNHAQASFPTSCNDCHSTSAWKPASFDHDSKYFPIYSGKHREEWNSCSNCHTTSSNYAIFSCLNCHEHNASSTNGDHKEVKNYSYNSDACLSCHPQGRD